MEHTPFIYIAGDIMSNGAQWELEQIENIVKEMGYDYYSPIKNKDINDKKNVTVEENNVLAERILAADTERLRAADIVIFNVQSHAVGTLVEIGQCLGMLDDTIDSVRREAEGVPQKAFFFLFSDIRRTDLPEIGDRRSWSINQYLHGAILALSDGKGISELSELKSFLENYGS